MKKRDVFYAHLTKITLSDIMIKCDKGVVGIGSVLQTDAAKSTYWLHGGLALFEITRLVHYRMYSVMEESLFLYLPQNQSYHFIFYREL